MSLERAGFFGHSSLGGGYEWSRTHSLEFLIGAYPNDGHDNYQLNLAYRYSRWSVPFELIDWKPLQIGFFAMRSWDNDNYFLRSPNEYPQDNYYEQTIVRFGLEVGTTVFLTDTNFALAYRLRFLDNGLVALYNNTNKDLQYYTSSGLALQFYFK